MTGPLIVFALAAALGAALGLALCGASVKYPRPRNRELRAAVSEGDRPMQPETTKRVIWTCLHGTLRGVKAGGNHDTEGHDHKTPGEPRHDREGVLQRCGRLH